MPRLKKKTDGPPPMNNIPSNQKQWNLRASKYEKELDSFNVHRLSEAQASTLTDEEFLCCRMIHDEVYSASQFMNGLHRYFEPKYKDQMEKVEEQSGWKMFKENRKEIKRKGEEGRVPIGLGGELTDAWRYFLTIDRFRKRDKGQGERITRSKTGVVTEMPARAAREIHEPPTPTPAQRQPRSKMNSGGPVLNTSEQTGAGIPDGPLDAKQVTDPEVGRPHNHDGHSGSGDDADDNTDEDWKSDSEYGWPGLSESVVECALSSVTRASIELQECLVDYEWTTHKQMFRVANPKGGKPLITAIPDAWLVQKRGVVRGEDLEKDPDIFRALGETKAEALQRMLMAAQKQQSAIFLSTLLANPPDDQDWKQVIRNFVWWAPEGPYILYSFAMKAFYECHVKGSGSELGRTCWFGPFRFFELEELKSYITVMQLWAQEGNAYKKEVTIFPQTLRGTSRK